MEVVRFLFDAFYNYKSAASLKKKKTCLSFDFLCFWHTFIKTVRNSPPNHSQEIIR